MDPIVTVLAEDLVSRALQPSRVAKVDEHNPKLLSRSNRPGKIILTAAITVETDGEAENNCSTLQAAPPADELNTGDGQRGAVNVRQVRGDTAKTSIAVDRLNSESIRQEQREDPVVGLLVRWPENPESQPSLNELVTLDPEVQRLYAQKATLELRDGILYRQFYGADAKIRFYQLIVPRSLRIAWLEAIHNHGHQAAKITGERLRQYAYWEGWKNNT